MIRPETWFVESRCRGTQVVATRQGAKAAIRTTQPNGSSAYRKTKRYLRMHPASAGTASRGAVAVAAGMAVQPTKAAFGIALGRRKRVYSVINVRSPAPPTVALVGLPGMLAGENLLPLARYLLDHVLGQVAGSGIEGWLGFGLPGFTACALEEKTKEY